MKKSLYTKLAILYCCCTSFYNSNAQTLNWVGSIENSNYHVEPYSILQDANQDLYVVGNFRETADFDMGAGTSNLTSTGNRDAFVAKYDVNGNFTYAFNIGSTATGPVVNTRAYDIAVDGLGNIIVVGEFRGSGVNFAPLGGIATSLTSATSGSDPSAFVAKYTTAGQCLWAMGIGSGALSAQMYAVEVDATNNIYVGGRLDDDGGTIDVNPLGTAHSMNTNGEDAVLIKYNSSGQHVWDLSIGSSSTDYAYGIEINGNKLYLTGEFQNTCEFNALGSSIQRTSMGSYDGFLAEYSTATGICSWVNQIGGTGSDEVRKASLDTAGNVYITGMFANTVDFDPSGSTSNLNSSGSNDIFVAKYSSIGTYVWALPIGGADADYGYDLAVDSNNVYTTGKFRGTVDFDPSAATANLIGQGTAKDEAFVAKYTTGGAYQNAFSIEGPDHDRGYGIVANGGAIYLTGYFEDANVDFDPVGTSLLSSTGGTTYHNGFIAAYSDAVQTADIAITEWLANPSGTDSEEEWIEIYNYGSSNVNLKDWRVKDEDGNDAVISAVDLFLPVGESLILARNKTKFEEHWLKSCASDKVVQVAINLANNFDEIILEDNNGTTVWSVAYANDETVGRATHYTEATYPTKTFGSKASPGVDRTGNDVTGTLGYERNNTTADANAFTNDIGDVGSPISDHLMDYTRGNTILTDGVNDHLNLGATTSLEGQSGFTFETWVKPISIDAAAERIFSKRSGNTNRIEISMGNGGSTDADRQFLIIHICNGTSQGATIPNGSVPLGRWSHVAVVFDGTQSGADRLKVFVNGIAQVVSLSPSATLTPSGNGNAHIGKRSDSNNKPSNVELDEVRLWNVARTEQAVRENMHLTLTGCETGLVSYYQLNETTGTTATDVKGNNNGTLVNGTSRNVSPINIGNSISSNSQTITGIATATVQSFTTANLVADLTAKTGTEDWTVTYQQFAPNTVAGANGSTIYNIPTWTINSSNSSGSYVGNLTFTFPAGSFTSTDAMKYRLYNRAMNDEGDWKEISIGSTVTGNTITFRNIEVLGQFFVVQQSADGVIPLRGNMYAFNGTSDYMDMGNPTALNMNTAITIEGWVKMNNTIGDQKIVTKFGDVSGDDAYALQIISGEPSFYLNFGATWVGSRAGMTVNSNEWYHIAGVYDGATIKIYVNGVEQNSVAQTGNFDIATSTFKIGAWTSGNYWNGNLDEICVWNAARTEAEIRENMHLTLKGNEANLAAYYQFNSDDPLNTVGGVKDALGASNGTTIGMTGAAYVASEVAVAGGVSQTISIPTSGPYAAIYSEVGLLINFGGTTPDGDVVVSRLETEKPDGWNTLTGVVDNEYFVIRNYGNIANFSALTNISLLDVGYIDPVDAAQPEVSSPLSIYKRPSNAYGGTWGSALANASTATSGHNGQVNFDNSAGITSFSQLALVSTSSSLPVELLTFEAVRRNVNQVALEWVTASEINNQGFQVERMLESETAFKEIAWVEGKGTSVVTNYYHYLDENSAQETSYYRLKQVDFDGTTTYSEVRAVEGEPSGKYIDWSIYPNPTSGPSQIVFMQVPKGVTSASIKLVTMDGKLIYQTTSAIKSNQKIKLDFIKDLAAGAYLLSIETNDGELLQDKIIKH